MKELKFLHCADIHLDAPFTSLGAATDRSDIRRLELKETFQKIIDIAKEEKVDFLLISGDLYEHNYVKKSTIHFINDRFNEIPDIKVFVVPGNHDPYINNSYYRNYKWGNNVYILTGDNPCVTLEDMGICIYGVGFRNFYEEESLVSNFKPANPEFINLLLIHGTLDMDFTQNAHNPIKSEVLTSLGMDYIALGHFHNRVDCMAGCKYIYNPGSPEPLGFDETGEHGIYMGAISKLNMSEKSLDIQFRTLNKKYYENLEVKVEGCSTDEQIIAKILGAIESRDIKRGLFCITLTGYVDHGLKINIAHIQSYFKDRLFYLKLKDETSVDYKFEEIIKEPGLRGLFTRKIFSRIEKCKDENEKKMLMKALYYGMEAIEHGIVEI